VRRNFHPTQCKYIVSVGVEVECGIRTDEHYRCLQDWVNEHAEVADRFEMGSDGSVYISDCIHRSLELRYWTYVEKFEWMERLLWQLWNIVKIVQNETCGNHVHLVVRDEYLPLLVYPQFVKYFQQVYLLFSARQTNPSKYYARTRGSYSSFYRGNIEAQVIQQYRGGGSRYRVINYHSLSEWQRTLEIRIMPYAESFGEHLSQILFVLRTVENYISTVLKGRRVLECSEVSLPTSPITQLRRLWCSFSFPQTLEVQTVEVENELPPLLVEVNNQTIVGGEL
jgi:hypothetical protein